MKTKNLTLRGFFAAVLLFFPGLVGAQELELQVNLENPVLLAGRSQVTWLKVGVKGFERIASGQRPPINLALVLDRSGSMEGEKMEKAKEAALYAVDLLSCLLYTSRCV